MFGVNANADADNQMKGAAVNTNADPYDADADADADDDAEIDVNKFIGRDHFSAKELKLGLTLLVDTNFNRQYSLKEKKTTLNHHHDTIGTRIQIIHHSDILHLIVDAILQTSNTQDIKIYIGTIGMYQLLF